MGSVKDAFTQEYLNKLGVLSLRLENRVKGGYSGNRRSKAKGSSVEFSDFRNYIKGDDVRRIDWNSYARLNKLFIRLFEEEKQANVNIFLDNSKSMDFGEKNKFTYGKVLAASIAYLTVNKSDRVSIFTFNNKLSLDIKGLSHKQSFSRILDYLDGLESFGPSALDSAVSAASPMNLGSGMNIIISDFLDRAGYENAVKILSRKSGHFYAVQILSEEELEPENTTSVRFIDSEDLSHIDLEMDEALLNAYKKELHEYNKALEMFCAKNKTTFLSVSTSMPYMEQIFKMTV